MQRLCFIYCLNVAIFAVKLLIQFVVIEIAVHSYRVCKNCCFLLCMNGIIIKNISNDYTVDVNGKYYICKPRGLFRKNSQTPLVGDEVVIDEKNNYILEIKKRKNELIRPSIANVDIAVIVTSVKEPNFDSNLLDKQLTIISWSNITPIIYFNKLDLLSNDEKNEITKIINYYKEIGYIVTTEKDELLTLIKNKIVVLTGQSGAGKSTLLNILDYSLKVTSGKVLFQDKQLNKRQIKSLKQKHIRKVYQNHNLIPYYNFYKKYVSFFF